MQKSGQDILVIGNYTKDVYLRLDPTKNHSEKDHAATPWLDFAFDGSSHYYFSRVPILGGSAITEEIFRHFQLYFYSLHAQSIPYRYILSLEDQVHYLSPQNFPENFWLTPVIAPRWIFIDRSANLSQQSSRAIASYLKANPSCLLAIFISQYSKAFLPHMQELINLAKFKITDLKQPRLISDLEISETEIKTKNYIGKWSQREKDALKTHLSINQTIAATFFASLCVGYDELSALKLTLANLENASLSSTTSHAKLLEYIQTKQFDISPREANSH